MKTRRYRYKIVAFFLTGLFVLLAVFGIWNVIHYGTRWFTSSHNTRINAQKSNVIEGSILDRNETVLAETADGVRVFQKDPEDRKAVVHVIGDRNGKIANAVESFQTEQLYGFRSSLPDQISFAMSGEALRGNNVILTLDSKLNRRIMDAFNSRCPDHRGAVVIVNWITGEILGEVSLPSFDPDEASSVTEQDPGQPYWNRATQGLYPPGSTFKIVTAAAALTTIPDINDWVCICTGAAEIDADHTIHDFQQEVHGKTGLADAFRLSCNPAFSGLALEIGDQKLRATAESFGFNKNFLFSDLVVYNSVYPSGNRTRYEVAASGIGQSAIVATPMHMCLIAASVANGGKMPEPVLIREIRSPAGRSISTFKSSVAMTVCAPETASKLTGYMRQVVQNGGSGWRANITGMDICGKTGTAESELNGVPINYGWFVGFNADPQKPYALCILVEDIPDGETGGTTSSVIAADLFRYLNQIGE